jgi:hypothetical protein
MRKKYGKYYADWRDQHGKRHMKAFPTAKAAKRYAEKQRKDTAAKKHRAERPSRKSSTRGRKATRKRTHAAKPATASPKHSALSAQGS